MPVIVDVGKKKRKSLSIFGKDYETCDGTYVRDYIHVMDVANVHETSLNYFKENKKIEIFNLGTGKGYSVLEILNKFQKVNNLFISYNFILRRKGDVPISFANVEKIYKNMGWKAKHSLKDMCLSTWNFSKVKNDQV